jgi:hypothetical protein
VRVAPENLPRPSDGNQIARGALYYGPAEGTFAKWESFMRQMLLGLWILCAIAGLGLLGGCAQTGDQWDHKVVLASDLTPSALDGQWEGSWQSYEFYDNGLIHFQIVPADMATADEAAKLPAIASPPESGTQRFLARVKMWHFGLLAPEEFEMVLTATPGTDSQIRFHGNRDLGPLAGFCKYDGFIDGSKSVMSYVNRSDFGSVVLHRVVNAVK